MTTSVCIAKNVYGGDGLGRLGDGRVVFVPGAFAGECVKARIVEEKRNFVKAQLVEIEERSPERIEPELVVPGMVYANLSPAGEAAAKEAQLREFLARGRFDPSLVSSADARVLPKQLHYRNKVVYHFAKERGKLVIGYRTEPSHEIVDITNDPLACEAINAALGGIRSSLTALLTNGAPAVRKSVEAEGNVTVRWSARSGVRWWVGKMPKEPVTIKEVTCGKVFEVPADGFYQVNPEVGEMLAQAVVAEYEKGKGIAPEVLDLYCGVGVLGLCCRPTKLTGIESGNNAVEFARKNASSQGFEGARFFAEQVGRNTRRIAVGSRTCVIVDPPRGGLEPGVAEWLGRSRAPRIIYVSCDPATLMRDLKAISRGYRIESVRWFNMFPRTARFETMVVLSKKERK